MVIHHPDKKASSGRGDEKDPIFLKLKEAYDVLSNPEKRRLYDSNFEFDEWIPDELIPDEDFYAIYSPIFEANARFSEYKPW